MTAALRTARIAGLVLLAAAGWLLWPASAGGSTTYVVTHGVSMQPRFSTGDLAVLRTAGTYGIGDVVAYTSRTLGTTVMHRIVAVDGDAFVTQGDNNSWQDPDHPSAAQIKGRLWLRVPQGGAALDQLKQPWTVALLGVAGPALLWVVRPQRGRHRGGRRPAADRARAPRRVPALRPPTLTSLGLPALPAATRAGARQAAAGCAAVALLAGAGEAVLLALPATQTDTRTVVVAQDGRWDWSGTATVGATYPTGRIATGDPIYTRLAGPVTVSLHDTVSAPGLTGLAGSVRLALGVQTPDGWHADVLTGAPAAPVGGTAAASLVLDPAAAEALFREHVAEVGASTGAATLTITPEVALTGTVGARPFSAAALPALTFTMDGPALRPGGGQATLTASAPTTVTAAVEGPRRLDAGSFSVPLDVAGTVVGVLAVLAVLAAGACALAGRPGPAAVDAPLRDSGRLLPVRRFTPGRSVVDVDDPAALLRLAEKLDLLVLHTDAGVYAVQDGETTYLWTEAGPDAGTEPADEVADEAADGPVALRVVAPVA